MKLLYLTNICDPILKTDKKFRKHIRSLLVSEVYSSAFINSGYKSSDFDFLLSDNGNFTRLTKAAKVYKPRVSALDDELDKLEKNRKPLPASILKTRTKLNNEIVKTCEDLAKKNFDKITAKQLAISPSAIIGGEDTTIPVLQICGAFDERLGKNVPSLLKFQNNTIKLYSKQYKGEFGSGEALKNVKKYLVIHAVDYKSLEKALSNVRKKIKPDAIALSLGGPLKSTRNISSIKAAGKKVSYEANSHPESYILSIVLLIALRNNLAKNIPVHILGLGSPILILLAGYIFRSFNFVTIDSTSTYTDDLEDDKIFDITKLNLYRLAASCILDRTPYKGISPYFKSFEKKYKPDWKKIFHHFNDTRNSNLLTTDQKLELIKEELEKKPELLKKYVPFFTPIKKAHKIFVKDLRIARAFENYWANNALCMKLSSFRTSENLTKYVVNEIERYKFYAVPQYYDAVIECKRLIDKFVK